jgi:hypothetical protein
MAEYDPFQMLRRRQALKVERVHRLSAAAQQWEGTVRSELRRLAQALWPDGWLIGLIPIYHYRLRHEITPEAHVWWIEHDIPPYDKYQCVAYRVRLSMGESNQPTLSVQSGKTAYAVSPMTKQALDAALSRAGQDPPLVIPRQMGEVTD